MLTHFKNRLVRTLFLTLAIMPALALQAQNFVHVSVLPPYTNRLDDYANTPNKVVVNITINPSTIDNFSGKVFFRGKLKSASGDIEISSRPGYRPAVPVNLPMGAPGMPITYVLPFNEIQTLFDWNNLIYSGISKEGIMQYGMPEELYTFCIETYDYETLALIIPEQCSAAFNVSLLEPPIIISPMNESTLFMNPIQSLLFNWATTPVPNRIPIQYALRMVEMAPGVNAQDALRTNNYPFRLFETTVMGNTFLYTDAQPKLEAGKKYAFAVIAADPEMQSLFRNSGMSEIYTFEMEDFVPPPPSPLPPTVTKKQNAGLLTFIYPKMDIAHTDIHTDLNASSSFLLTWNWQDFLDVQVPKAEEDTLAFKALYQYCQEMGIEQYRLTFKDDSDQTVYFERYL